MSAKRGSFSVRDLRENDYFRVDNAFVRDKWMRLLKGCPAAVYFVLCRHAGRDEVSFPSIPYLVDETGYARSPVIRAIKVLEFHRIIKVDREKREVNFYSLLNRKHWRKQVLTGRTQPFEGTTP